MIKKKEVTTGELARLSCALTVADSTSTAALRSQDILGQIARDVHALTRTDNESRDIDIKRSLLPRDFKNVACLKRTDNGVVVNHVKADMCVEAYAVMIVIGRRMVRRLLEKKLEERSKEMEGFAGGTLGI